MVVVHVYAQLGVLYEGLGQTTTHSSKVAKGTSACGSSSRVFIRNIVGQKTVPMFGYFRKSGL